MKCREIDSAAGSVEKKKKRGKVGRPRNGATDTIAARLNTSKRTAERMVKRGITEKNVNAVASARKEKIDVEVALQREKLAILKREYVSAVKVREDSLAAFAIVRQVIVGQEVQLPPLLEGLTAKEMRTVLAGHGERLLKDLSERLAAIA